MSESELSVQIRHDWPASPFCSIQFWWYQQLHFDCSIQFWWHQQFITTSAITSSSLLHIQQISKSTATQEHFPTLLGSFAIPLVSKIVPAITFCKPIFFNFFFGGGGGFFVPLFISSSSEWPRFFLNNYINISFKEIFIDSVEKKYL